MQTKAKSNSVVTTSLVEGKLVIAVLGSGSVTFDPSKADKALRQRAEMHGWTQRLVDAAAMSRDDVTGQPATPADKFEAIKGLADHYMSGTPDWSRKSAGGFGKSITLAAIALVQGITYEAAEANVAAMAKKRGEEAKETLKFLATGGRVMKAIAEIRAKAVKPASVDADKALAEMK